MRPWRKEPTRTGWRLVTGARADRVRVSLGRVTEAEAEAARVAMQRAEDRGDVGRVLALHERDADAAVRYLVGDPGLDASPVLPVDHGALTLAAYQAEHYATWRAAERPRSWRSEASHWSRLLRPEPEGLGDVRVRDLAEDPRIVHRYLRDLRIEPSGGDRRSGEPRAARPLQPPSGAYQRLLRAALQALLTHAYTERHLDTHARLGELRISGSTTRAREQVDPLTLDEIVRLMDAAGDPLGRWPEEGAKHRAMWGTGAGLGLRPSELCRLRWEDVRWSSRTLAVRGEKTAQAADEVPLTPIALQELRTWWIRQGQPADGLAFPASLGDPTTPYSDGSSYRRALRSAARRAGIDREVNPYLLRHSFATIAWSLGIDIDLTRRIMRHKDETMLRRVYQRPRPADLVERVAAFSLPREDR